MLVMKKCSRCGVEKGVEEFGRDSSREDGRYPYCHPCKTSYMHAYKAQPEVRARIRATNRARKHHRLAHEPGYRERRKAYERMRKLRMRHNGPMESVALDELLLRDGPGCALCGLALGEDITLEHKVPLSRGGTHTRSNLALAHHLCNSQKGRMTLDEWQASRATLGTLATAAGG